MLSPTCSSISVITDESPPDRLLNIKYILNHWGSIQDGPLTVGECFENPSNGGDISNSIVRVARFPPTASELENPQRFASIARESTARPQKRHFENFMQPPARDPSPLPSCEAADDPDWGFGQLRNSHGATTKRRKIRDHRRNEYNLLGRPIVSSGDFGDGGHNRSQSPARHLSPSVQVVDSQRSILRKRMSFSKFYYILV